MEKESIYEKICTIFPYYKNTKTLIYSGKDSIFKNLLFLLCFLEEKGQIIFKCLNELWFFKEFKNEALIKLILDIIESLISIIKDKNFDLSRTNINLVKTFLKLIDYDTFEIFRYLQSIYSS